VAIVIVEGGGAMDRCLRIASQAQGTDAEQAWILKHGRARMTNDRRP